MKKAVLLILGIGAFVSCKQEKTAYVDNLVLMQEYKGMSDLEAEYTKKSDDVNQTLDSIAKAFQTEVQEYQKAMENMSMSERQKREEELMAKQNQLRQQERIVSSELQRMTAQATDSLVKEVKGLVADYGKEHGYTYIFGSTDYANILYAKEGLDITQEVLKALNADYKGEPIQNDTIQ
jgi:outer membrane protein